MSELIFLDLEWNTTFYRSRTGERLPFHELIEVAAIKVEKDTGAMLDSFHSYICPKASRKIENRTYRLLPYERGELQELLYAAPGFLDLTRTGRASTTTSNTSTRSSSPGSWAASPPWRRR